MRPFLLLIQILIITTVYGQTEKLISIPIFSNHENEVDTSQWFKSNQVLVRQINLKDLKTSKDSFHFRLWSDIQAVDLWTVDHTSYFASVTNYAQRYDPKLYRKGIYTIDNVFSNQIQLDSVKARQIFNLIQSLSIMSIPTDSKINGWSQGFDGEEFLIETSTPTLYFFKTYWTPRVFADSLWVAKQIQSFVDRLYKDFNIEGYYLKLKLPAGNYKRNGIQGIQINPQNENPGTKNSIKDWLYNDPDSRYHGIALLL